MSRLYFVVRKLTGIVEMQRVAIEELFQFSRHAYDVMHDLNTRVIQLEGGVDTSFNQNDRDITSRVTELDREFMSIGTQVSEFGNTVTNSNTLAALDSAPGEQSAPRDLSNVMVNIQHFATSAQASTHLITHKASRRLMTDDVQAGRITKTGVAKQSKKLKLEIPDNVTGIGVASPSNSVRRYTVLSVPKLTLSGFSSIAAVCVRTIGSCLAHHTVSQWSNWTTRRVQENYDRNQQAWHPQLRQVRSAWGCPNA